MEALQVQKWKKVEIWTEEVNTKDFVKRNIELTPSNRLPSNVVKDLKKLY